jgi:arginyl-tRNA synthetase
MSRTTTDVDILPSQAVTAFASALTQAIASRYPHVQPPNIAFEAPRRPEFGDFATNVAFALAKAVRSSPASVAKDLLDTCRADAPEIASLFSALEPVGGFINLRLAPSIWHNAIAAMLREGERFGHLPRNGLRVSLEFGSANPTGPLVVVQGRTLALGDALARAFRRCGYDVFVEWIINDAGNQMETLARSLYARYAQCFDECYAFPEEGYPGEYLLPIAAQIAHDDGERWLHLPENDWLPVFAQRGRDTIVATQRATAQRFGVTYDLWQSERELHESGRVLADIDRLRELGHTYEEAGALFFRASAFGDDKDRVVIRRDGRPTYYGADIAYHYEKLKRADRVIDILGPDHHGYIGRLKGLAHALGFPGHLDVLIAQQITLMRGSEIVSMSKRAGNIVTLDDILDEVGVDAARFFFAMPAADSPLTFDLALAVEHSAENPVFYVQYGHARIASVLRKAEAADVEAARAATNLTPLQAPSELTLTRRLYEFPQVVQGVVDHLAPHRLAKYARDVATDFHQFYTECTILVDDPEVRIARLALCVAAKNILAAVLATIGISAPESM